MWNSSNVSMNASPTWNGSLQSVNVESSWNSGYTQVNMESTWNSGYMQVNVESSWNSNYLKINVSGCFPETELVHINDGFSIPIGLLKIGDKVISWDKERAKAQYTAITGIRKCIVFEIMTFNNAMRCSACHPLLVMETGKNNMITPKWKMASDVNVGDCVVGANGEPITVKTKSRHWYNTGTEVISIATDNGLPFFVGNCAVMAENSSEVVERVQTTDIQKLSA